MVHTNKNLILKHEKINHMKTFEIIREIVSAGDMACKCGENVMLTFGGSNFELTTNFAPCSH